MYSFGFEWTRLCTYPIFTEWLTVVSCTIVCSKSHAVTPCKFIWCFWMYQAYRYSPFIPRFFIKTFLKAVFTAKLRERSRDFPCTPCPSNTHNLPLYHPSMWAIVPLSATPPEGGTRGTAEGPTLTCDSHPEPTVDVGAEPWRRSLWVWGRVSPSRHATGSQHPETLCTLPVRPPPTRLLYSFWRKHLRYKWL